MCRLKMAKVTEQENFASLEQYREMEIEQKRRRQNMLKKQKLLRGSRVKMSSMRFNATQDCESVQNDPVLEPSIRTFIECSDEAAFNRCVKLLTLPGNNTMSGAETNGA